MSTETISLSVPGNPGDAAVNGWKQPVQVDGRTRVVEGKRYRSWKASAKMIFRSQARGQVFAEGPIRVGIVAHWPRMGRSGPATGLAFGDCDAPIKAVLDALEASGVIGGDAQVVEVTAAKRYSASEPRIDVEVSR